MVLASYDASVLPDGRRLGIHLPLATGMVKPVDRAMTIRGSRARDSAGCGGPMTADRARPSSAQVDLAVLLGLLAVATVMRLPDLATRGTWDADQGHDMLVLRGAGPRRGRARCSDRRRRSATSTTGRSTTTCSPRPRS